MEKFKSSAVAVLLLAAGMVLGYWLAPQISITNAEAKSDALSVQSLQIVDAAGKRRILMTTLADGNPAIWFFDRNGKSKLNLGLYEDDNAFVVLNDGNEQAVQILRTIGGENSPVLVQKSGGQDKVILRVDGAPAEPSFVYYDKQGSTRKVF